ncbi:MAG: GAF domain-containing protein [Candidatus Hodarchaeales archaeon]
MLDSENSLKKDFMKGLAVIPFPIAIINTQGRVLHVNKPFKDIVGQGVSKFADLFHSKLNADYYLDAKRLNDEQIILKTTNGFISANLSLSPLVGNEDLLVCLIRELSPTARSKSFLQFIRDNIGIVAYTLGLKGPSPFFIDNMYFISNLEVTLVRMGLYLMTAIGQGQDHASGLFGPLPVPGHEEYLVIVYSFTIPDEMQRDPRLNKKSYVLLTLVFPAFVEEMINDRIHLRNIFRGEIRKLNRFQDITGDFFWNLKKEILLEDISADKLTRTLERKLSALYHMSQALLESPENSFKIIIDYVESVLDFKYFAIIELVKDKNQLIVVAATGYERDLIHVTLDLSSHKSVVAKCARDSAILNIPDVKKCDFYLGMDPIIQSELAVPVIMNGRVFGVINAESEKPSVFSDSDVQLMKNLAGRIALVFRQRLLEDKLKAVRALIHELVDEKKDHNQVFQTITEFAGRVLDLKIFAILLVDQRTNKLKFLAHRGYPPDFDLDNLNIPLQTKRSVCAKAAREGITINIRDVKEIDFFLETDSAIQSEIAVPIKDSAGKVLGIVNAEALQINAFNKEDEEFLEILAHYVAIILKIYDLQDQG